MYVYYDSNQSYRDLPDDNEKRHYDRRVPYIAFKTYYYSNFRHMFLSGNDKALLNSTGHDHSSFRKLLHIFKAVYDLCSWDSELQCICTKKLDENVNPKGRTRDMTACGCLSLVLMWYRTKGSCVRSLAMHFGQTSTPMYMWLKFGRKILLHVISRDIRAMSRLPSDEQVEYFCSDIEKKYPVLVDVWGAIDSLKLLIQEPTDDKKQNQLFNGWKYPHTIN